MPMTMQRGDRRLGPYKDHLACFRCRKAFKTQQWDAVPFGVVADRWRSMGQSTKWCPDCGDWMRSMGPNFRAPKRSHRKAWRTAERLADLGFHFGPECCNHHSPRGPFDLPVSSREFREFLRELQGRDAVGRILFPEFAGRPRQKPRACWQPVVRWWARSPGR